MFVIGTSVAKMAKAKEFLEAEGYTVQICEKYVEPEMTLESLQAKEVEFEGWPLLDPYEDGFASTYSMCKEPTMFIQYSKTRFNDENGSYSYGRGKHRFDHNAVHALRNFFNVEKIVVINHPNKVRTLKKMGVISVRDKVDEMIRKMLADPNFTKKLAMHSHAREYGALPDGLLQMPEFSKVLGLPYIRTRELVKFRQALQLFDTITECTSDVFCSPETRDLLRLKMSVDPKSVSRSSAILKSLDVLDANVLKNRINGMGEGERKVYAEKLARFIRTTAT